MKNISKLIVFYFLFYLTAAAALGQQPGTMAITVSMERPEMHYYHVIFRCDGLQGEAQDFKMPNWTPGYYEIMNYSKEVVNFRAADGAGHALAWRKTASNTWHVDSGKADAIAVSYDVYAFKELIADSYLDDERGYIVPAGVFMHVGGALQHPVTLTVEPYQGWNQVASGLDPVAGKTHTYSAPDFDVLYDCPILMGNLEVLPFEVRGIPHEFVGYNLGAFERAPFVEELKSVVEAAVAIVGEIPYKHYTFLAVGPGDGGLEHANSAAIGLTDTSLGTVGGAAEWISLLAHEYFHLYNVKRIRPIELGPFDYDKENYTRLLWVAEGITQYYENLILARAGIIDQETLLGNLRGCILNYETRPGHRLQSATESSFDTWIAEPFGGGGSEANATNTTVSYYDKGAVLGMLLDFKIRHETKNRKSLDDVMRALYEKYNKQLKRGFTDEEFRAVCENVAGCALPEIFEYASTVKEIDYPKYLAFAGLDIAMPRQTDEPFIGVEAQDQNGSCVITNVESDSPAERAGLSVQDEILALGGVRVNSRNWSGAIAAKKPGDKIRVLIARLDKTREIEVTLAKKIYRSYRIEPLANPDPLQTEILQSWVNGKE